MSNKKIETGFSGPIVKLENVTKNYPLGKIEVPALKGINLEIRKGDFIAVAGPSGAGKTTIMNIIGLIDKPTAGTVQINGRNAVELNDNEITTLRHRFLGFIFQSFNLIPVLNVYENIELPLLLNGKPPEKKERRQWIDYLIEEVGLTDWRTHRPSELSGGQRQRVAIARALAAKPDLVIADEPTANLDSQTGETILQLMKTVNKEQKTTFLFSTHDSVIRDMADHKVLIKDGLIQSEEKKNG